MNFRPFEIPWSQICFSVILTLSCPSVSSGVTLSLRVDPDDTTVWDPAYPGTQSTITTRTDNQTPVTVSVSGRDYGSDPTAGAQRWGLNVRPLLWLNSSRRFVITGGFSPSVLGSTVSGTGAPASYVSISLSNVAQNTLFQNVSVELSGVLGMTVNNAWGATSADGFVTRVTADSTPQGNRFSLQLGDLLWTGTGPLEIRFYGLTSGITVPFVGSFTSVRIQGDFAPLPVPEPITIVLLGAGLAAIAGRRQRRAIR